MSTTSNTYSSAPNTQPNKQEQGYVEQAANALSSAAATVTSYLPTGVTNAVSSLNTDSTTAYRNQQPHVGGVGDLGTQSTQDVAVLPEERQNPDPYAGTGPTTNLAASNPAFNSPSGVQNQYNNRVEGETFPSAGNAGVGAPTTQTSMTGIAGGFGTAAYGVGGHAGQPGGVGSMGTSSSNDVARLPEERANPDPLASAPGAEATTGSQSMIYGVGGHPGEPGGVGDLGTQSTQDVALLPEERAHPDPYSESNTSTSAKDKVKTVVNDGLGGHGGRHHDMTKDGSTGGHTGANYDVDHGLGMPHTRSTAPTTSSTTRATEDASSPPSTHKEASHAHSGANQDENESVPSPKEAGYPTGKPSLMDKVKGTAIVAKAKMSKDQEKIHEGQMLKETGKKVNPEEEARRSGSMDQSQD